MIGHITVVLLIFYCGGFIRNSLRKGLAMKTKIIPILSLTLILSLSQITNATIVEYPLNDFIGAYGLNNSRIANIDIDVEFSDISSISIDWSGDITAGLSNYLLSPPENDPFPSQGVFCAYLYKTNLTIDTFGEVFKSGGIATYPNPEPFNDIQTFSDHGWSLFNDGLAILEIRISPGTPNPGEIIVEWPSGNINSAILRIEGTVVPEPASLLILTAGSFWICRYSRKRRNI